MSAQMETIIKEKVHLLSEDKQHQVLAVVESLLREDQAPSAQTTVQPIWEEIAELMSDVESKVLELIPSDGAMNHDHYLYGAPKK